MSRSIAWAATALILCSSFPASAPAQEFRTIDGTGNHLTQAAMGSAGTPLVRSVPSDYADGVSTPSGATRPSARLVSNLLCAQGASIPNQNDASDFIWQWGQFLDHDIDLTPTIAGDPLANAPILVPAGDPFFDPTATGTATIGFTRSIFEAGSSPRQQLNAITAWIDASNVYGSDTVRALELRTLDGTGRLKTTPGGLLPMNTAGLPNAELPGFPADSYFLAGDVRANEQAALTAMHTLFVREHNRLAADIAASNPLFTGEEIYLRARRIVGAQMQRISYEEFFPLLLGPGALPPYTGYQPSTEAGIRNIFSTACYRFGHSMLSSTLRRLSESGIEISEGNLPLAAAFFAPTAISEDGGIEPILRGLATQRAEEIDPFVVGAIRNFLFGPPGAGGFDLASLNIQRGRDHGLPGYNATRVALGLSPMATFSAITTDPAHQQALTDAYGTVDAIDLWVGGLAEDHVPGAMVGELLRAVLVEQFTALRDGDRFWYQIDLPPAELAEVEATSLSAIITRNTSIQFLPSDVFRVGNPDFVRGDCNIDASYDISDAVFMVGYLFVDGPAAGCMAACDINDDSLLDIADAIYTLNSLFQNGTPPAFPYPNCGTPGTGDDDLPCFEFAVCP